MNYGYLSDSDEEDDEFIAWCKDLGVSWGDYHNWDKHSPEIELVRKRVEESWNKMFGVKPVNEDWFCSWGNRTIQGTFWEIRSEYVLSAELFPNRKLIKKSA